MRLRDDRFRWLFLLGCIGLLGVVCLVRSIQAEEQMALDEDMKLTLADTERHYGK